MLSAQSQYDQIVRGVILEKSTQEVLSGVTVMVRSGGKEFTATTNEKGEFVFSGIPVGRCNVSVSMLGFTPYTSNSVLVYSGKETVLEIALEENVYTLEEIVISSKVDKGLPLNRMVTVSARMLSSEEANRYAGTMGGDISRMVAGFAGVVASNDTRNDIVIRGNSPIGLLWRLDGFEIPNPNHFGRMGGTGGGIGMLNNNQLANSDFYTGAFPAEFGNATSGVFDLHLRNGNNQRHEFLASIGINGFELGAEGPISKKTGASYLINGRYSFLSILKETGVNFYGLSVPEYQDVCAKINVPTKHGNFSWITLMGTSQVGTDADANDPLGWESNEEDMNFYSEQLFTGVNYTHRFNTSTRLENRLSYQLLRIKVTDRVTYYGSHETSDYYVGNEQEGKIAWQSVLNHRINAKNLIKSGVGIDILLSDIHNGWLGSDVFLNDYKGTSNLLKAFTQWQHRFNNVFSVTPGVYSQFYTLSSDYSIEPRIAFKWEVSPFTSFGLSGGLYSQLQPRQVYVYEESGIKKNMNLKMTKSWQCVVGYSQKLGADMHLKTEVYYQSLFNIPVTPKFPEESLINMGDEYYNDWNYMAENKGTGYNYGLEVSLEKFFDKHYYFLLTVSLYDSKYKGYDKIKRSTKFAGNYAFNTLFGYEWKIGTKHLLSVNTKVAYTGGKRYVPIIVDWGKDFSQAYKNRLPDYFRVDLNINMKSNFKRWSIEWFAEVNNLTNHRNVWMKRIYFYGDGEDYLYQYGFLPMGGCRVYF